MQILRPLVSGENISGAIGWTFSSSANPGMTSERRRIIKGLPLLALMDWLHERGSLKFEFQFQFQFEFDQPAQLERSSERGSAGGS